MVLAAAVAGEQAQPAKKAKRGLSGLELGYGSYGSYGHGGLDLGPSLGHGLELSGLSYGHGAIIGEPRIKSIVITKEVRHLLAMSSSWHGSAHAARCTPRVEADLLLLSMYASNVETTVLGARRC